WQTDVTLSHNKGTFSRIPTLNKTQQQAGNFENQLFKMIEGEKLGTFWGHTYEGVWQESEINAPFIDAKGNPNGKTNGATYNIQAGVAKYRDVNLDGKINNDDMGIIGNGQPMFNWGWSNNISYKNLDLSLFIVGFHGFDIYNATDQIGYNTVLGQVVESITPKRAFLNRWTKENTNTDIPGFVYEKSPIKSFNTRFVEKGSFVKVKSITMGYTLPATLCKSIGMENLRVYASIQNPFHFTSYSGLDPEATMGSPLVQGVDWGAYPNSRNYLIGLNFSF
ncbi:MAG: SusC/RagA family TonB-linked outer membrane protein, partial [Bacteroides sp.]